MFHSTEQRFRFQDHAFAPPEGPVIHRLMLVGSKGSQVMNRHGNPSLLLRLLNHAEVEGTRKKARKDCDNIEVKTAHGLGITGNRPGALKVHKPFWEVNDEFFGFNVDPYQQFLHKRNQDLALS